MRVIAGLYRSRQFATLPGLKLRPTSDRLRETLFNVLTAGALPVVGSTWCDLFAGSGAIGIEALSRGAAMVYFVEAHRTAAALINRNLASLRISAGFEVLANDAVHGLRQLAARNLKCDFCFLDPPWADAAAYTDTLAALATSPLLKPSAITIAEHDRRNDPGEAFSGAAGTLKRFRKLVQGDAALSFYGIS